MMKKIAELLILLVVLFPYSAMSETAGETTTMSGKPQIELVFALDTTGSMSGLIEAAKDKIWSIANSMATAKPAPNIKIGIVGYRDRGDTYITTRSDMTDNLDRVYQTLMGFEAQGGGDGPESVNRALYDAVHENNWSKDNKSTYKVIFLVGDAPPHMDYQDDVPYQTTCKAASEQGIIINTIQCGELSETQSVWEDIARRCDGNYFRVSQGGDSTVYETPYDKEISEKSKSLDGTKVYYGDKSSIEKARLKQSAVEDIYSKAKDSAIAKRSSFNLSGSGKKNFLGDQELIDSVTTGKVKIEEIKDSELPKDMQAMTVDERKRLIADKSKEREKVTTELRALTEKRQAYIQEKVSQEKDKGEQSLDMKIFKCIQKQAEEKNITYTDTLKY